VIGHRRPEEGSRKWLIIGFIIAFFFMVGLLALAALIGGGSHETASPAPAHSTK
jgi:hypothetical protein